MNSANGQKAVYSVRLPEDEREYIDSMASREHRSTSNTMLVLIKEAIKSRKLKNEKELSTSNG